MSSFRFRSSVLTRCPSPKQSSLSRAANRDGFAARRTGLALLLWHQLGDFANVYQRSIRVLEHPIDRPRKRVAHALKLGGQKRSRELNAAPSRCSEVLRHQRSGNQDIGDMSHRGRGGEVLHRCLSAERKRFADRGIVRGQINEVGVLLDGGGVAV